ncbi:MAG: triose-phosphate isomerase [Cyclobacteriaceae bacterium]|nr:triose-phosphate isomerase [Cyclobacteriaceae bacterium]
MRRNIAAGNWKMNTSLEEGMQLASEVVNMATAEVVKDIDILLIAPFTHLTSLQKIVGEAKNIFLGAQNCHEADSGAYTGEISAPMLKAIGVKYVVLGHSERREYFAESHALLASKTDTVLRHGMTPVFCCGEKLEIREQNKHFELVEAQIRESLFHLSADQMKKVVIAYEPVWAIGTGVTASAEQAQEMHAFIRKTIANKYSQSLADSISILYGGSVKAANANEIFGGADVDGGLVGGASLQSREFVEIAKAF